MPQKPAAPVPEAMPGGQPVQDQIELLQQQNRQTETNLQQFRNEQCNDNARLTDHLNEVQAKLARMLLLLPHPQEIPQVPEPPDQAPDPRPQAPELQHHAKAIFKTKMPEFP